jgi:hypothetical protein
VRSSLPWLDVLIASAFPLALIAVIWNRVQLKRGIAVRSIQFVGVALVVAGSTILALHGLLQGEAVAAIFGTTVGYLLASIMRFDERGEH